MYASELMELVRKNPEKYEGKKYKIRGNYCIYDLGGNEHKEIYIKSGHLYTLNHDLSRLALINCRTQVEEIKQPVTFMEAVKAKNIYCIYKNYKTSYKPDGNQGLKDNDDLAISVNEILYGTWYIESEDE